MTAGLGRMKRRRCETVMSFGTKTPWIGKTQSATLPNSRSAFGGFLDVSAFCIFAMLLGGLDQPRQYG